MGKIGLRSQERRQLGTQEICVITTVHNCLDTRIYFREIQSLSKRYVVDYYAPFNGESGTVQCSGKFVPLPLPRSKLGRIKSMLRLMKLLIKRNYCLYHLHDPELIPVGLILKLLKKKVVFDMHENVLIDIKTKKYIRPVLREVVYRLFNGLYRSAQKQFDWFILAENSYRKIMISNKYEIIYNYPLIREIKGPSPKKWPNGLVYVGSITTERGIWNMLRVFEKVQRLLPEALLSLVGPIDEEGLQSRIAEWLSYNSLAEKVHLYGRVPNDRVFDIIKHNSVGLCLLESQGGFQESFPTKMFEYMMASLPVVVSDFKLWRDIVEESNCGLVFDPRSHEEIADNIIDLLKDEKRLGELGNNGLTAIKRKYNWTSEEGKLFNIYKLFIKSN